MQSRIRFMNNMDPYKIDNIMEPGIGVNASPVAMEVDRIESKQSTPIMAPEPGSDHSESRSASLQPAQEPSSKPTPRKKIHRPYLLYVQLYNCAIVLWYNTMLLGQGSGTFLGSKWVPLGRIGMSLCIYKTSS
jgi:hypothetical protein